MVSRTRLKSLLTGLALYTVAALMVGYFSVNAYTGKYGLNARQELDQEIIALTSELARLKPLTPTWAAARDISHAVRGGRIPAWAKPLVEWLGFTPVAKVKADGKLGVAGGLVGKSRVPGGSRPMSPNA